MRAATRLPGTLTAVGAISTSGNFLPVADNASNVGSALLRPLKVFSYAFNQTHRAPNNHNRPNRRRGGARVALRLYSMPPLFASQDVPVVPRLPGYELWPVHPDARRRASYYTTTVTPAGGFTGTVTFAVSGLPANASASFNPNSIVTSGSTTMRVRTNNNTPLATSTLTMTATSGTLSHSITVTLTVTR